MNKKKKATIQLVNGTKLSGTLLAAGVQELLFEPKGRPALGVQRIPYDQLSTIRLDLGPVRGWQTVGAILGLVGGVAGGIRLAYSDNGYAGELAGVALILGSPFLGGKLLGDRHREWLVVEVR